MVVLKPNGDICIAVERETHVIPTTEEVSHDLNGSTVFSKLDLKILFFFYQVELDPASVRSDYHLHYVHRSFPVQLRG